jgi:hypothetical protein
MYKIVRFYRDSGHPNSKERRTINKVVHVAHRGMTDTLWGLD